MNVLEQAAQVLHEEAQAIEKLIDTLDNSFVEAVTMILGSKGRVVCTGMGNPDTSLEKYRLHWQVRVRRHYSYIPVKVCTAI